MQEEQGQLKIAEYEFSSSLINNRTKFNERG